MLKPPTDADIQMAVDAGAAKIDEVVASETPTGRYTQPRVNALAKVVSDLMALATGKEDTLLTEIKGTNFDRKTAPLPDALVRRILSLVEVLDAYSQSEGEPIMTDNLMTRELLTDEDLAVATADLSRALKDKNFKKWAAMMRVPVEAEAEEELAEDDDEMEMDDELSVLFS